MRKLTIYFILFCRVSGFSQETPAELNARLQKAKNDSVRILLLQQLVNHTANDAWLLHNDSILITADKALKKPGLSAKTKNYYLNAISFYYCNKALDFIQHDDIVNSGKHYRKSLAISLETGDKTELATAYNGLGYLKQYVGESDSALYFYERSADFHEAAGNLNEMAAPLGNMASIYSARGDIKKGLETNLRTLKIYEKTGDKSGMSYCLINMGQLFQKDGNLELAFDNFTKAYNIRRDLKDEIGQGNALQNIARIHQIKKEFDKAEKCLRESLSLHTEAGNKKGVSSTMYVLGVNFAEQGAFDSAYFYQKKALEIVIPLNEKQQLARIYDGLVQALYKLNRTEEAKSFALKELQLSRELGYPEHIRNAAENLKDIYKKQGDLKKAFEMFDLYIVMRDSIHNTETKKAAIKTQLKYEFDKKATADSVKNAEMQKVKDARLSAQQASLNQEKTLRYALYGGLVLIVCFLGFVYNRFRITNKQKKIIEDQKVLVDDAYEKLHEKNKEVLDSIHYARRIQRALITHEKYIEKSLNKLRNNS